MKNKRIYIYFAALSLVFLCLIALTAIMLSASLKYTTASPQETEILYVYLEESSHDSESISALFFIKEHNEKIGIFNSDGTLIKTIDTYVKALPEAERTALRQGFEVNSKKELYSIIEAYTD